MVAKDPYEGWGRRQESRQTAAPEIPKGTASIGLLSPKKQKIHERIFLRPGRLPGDPTVAFFLYD